MLDKFRIFSALKVTFNRPAKYSMDAIPVGNGVSVRRYGGGVSSGFIQLNEDTLWTGTPSDFTNPNAPEALLEVRKLVDGAQCAEASAASAKLFDNPADGLGRNGDDLVQKVRMAQPRLYPTKIAEDSSIMEWAEDFKDPEVHHRQLSPLFGLFPGHTITIQTDPYLCKAAEKKTLEKQERLARDGQLCGMLIEWINI